MEISRNIFNLHRYHSLLESRKLLNYMPSNTLLTYSYFIDYFSQINKISQNDFLYAVHVAYSWMPKMIELTIKDLNQINKILSDVEYLRGISNHSQLHSSRNEICQKLSSISGIINNSMVGISKVLHFFAPNNIPIIDSNVFQSWNQFFMCYPSVMLRGSRNKIKVDCYMDYWEAMLFWKQEVGLNSVRQIEESFYIMGRQNRFPD